MLQYAWLLLFLTPLTVAILCLRVMGITGRVRGKAGAATKRRRSVRATSSGSATSSGPVMPVMPFATASIPRGGKNAGLSRTGAIQKDIAALNDARAQSRRSQRDLVHTHRAIVEDKIRQQARQREEEIRLANQRAEEERALEEEREREAELRRRIEEEQAHQELRSAPGARW